MKIEFWSVGKNHDAHVKDAIDLYSSRIKHYFPCEWRIFAPSKLKIQAEAKSAEGNMLLQAKQQGDFLVSLDEYAKQMDSKQLANFIEKQSFKSIKRLIFVIGGAYGFDQQFLQKCDHQWSLSKLTFPHQLVRVILAEQVYRACTIIRNEQYHHQ